MQCACVWRCALAPAARAARAAVCWPSLKGRGGSIGAAVALVGWERAADGATARKKNKHKENQHIVTIYAKRGTEAQECLLS